MPPAFARAAFLAAFLARFASCLSARRPSGLCPASPTVFRSCVEVSYVGTSLRARFEGGPSAAGTDIDVDRVEDGGIGPDEAEAAGDGERERLRGIEGARSSDSIGVLEASG